MKNHQKHTKHTNKQSKNKTKTNKQKQQTINQANKNAAWEINTSNTFAFDHYVLAVSVYMHCVKNLGLITEIWLLPLVKWCNCRASHNAILVVLQYN